MIFKIRYPFDNSFQSSIIVEVRKPKLSRAFVHMKLVLGYPAYGPYMLFVLAAAFAAAFAAAGAAAALVPARIQGVDLGDPRSSGVAPEERRPPREATEGQEVVQPIHADLRMGARTPEWQWRV